MRDAPKTNAEARVKELESERDSESRWAKEYLERAEKAEAENSRLCERVRNQAERIRYLEGATNHATGTPLSAAEKRVKELESQLSLAQHHASGRWGEYDRALDENAKLREENKLLAGYFEDALTLCEDAQIATNITAKMRTMLKEALAQKGGAS